MANGSFSNPCHLMGRGIYRGRHLDAEKVLQSMDRVLKSFPEVERVFGKAGRSSTATDNPPLSMFETVISLKPPEQWRPGLTWEGLISEMDERLRYPGTHSQSLMYRWSGDLASPKSHALILHLGSRERRPIIIHELRWLVPPFRLTWAAETRGQDLQPRIEEGAGIEVELDPCLALSSVNETRHFKGWFRKLVLICELRLTVYLQAGEVIAKRIPSSMRSFLAMQHSFSNLSRGIIRAYAFIAP